MRSASRRYITCDQDLIRRYLRPGGVLSCVDHTGFPRAGHLPCDSLFSGRLGVRELGKATARRCGPWRRRPPGRVVPWPCPRRPVAYGLGRYRRPLGGTAGHAAIRHGSCSRFLPCAPWSMYTCGGPVGSSPAAASRARAAKKTRRRSRVRAPSRRAIDRLPLIFAEPPCTPARPFNSPCRARVPF